jgi:zinc-binding alcohol dehydrogenase family protein
MKAIGYQNAGPISNPLSLQDIELEKPVARGLDILVKISAIAVNPVDYKIRKNVNPTQSKYKVLGWDAVGEVVAVGDDVTRFKIGDSVYYAGDLTRDGSNAEYQLVDERLAALKPKNLSNAEAAALPLTTITAWELLFDHFGLKKQTPGSITPSKDIILVVGASGGVGSILVQLIKNLTGATVVATASRPATKAWAEALGADFVIDHSQALVPQVKALEIGHITHVAGLTHSDDYIESYIELLKPMGKIVLIDEPKTVDILKLKPKSLSLHWEFMFTRSMFQTDDMVEQHNLLSEVAGLIDAGLVKTTLGKHLGNINAQNLREAHTILESGTSIGKIVLEGF